MSLNKNSNCSELLFARPDNLLSPKRKRSQTASVSKQMLLEVGLKRDSPLNIAVDYVQSPSPPSSATKESPVKSRRYTGPSDNVNCENIHECINGSRLTSSSHPKSPERSTVDCPSGRIHIPIGKSDYSPFRRPSFTAGFNHDEPPPSSSSSYYSSTSSYSKWNNPSNNGSSSNFRSIPIFTCPGSEHLRHSLNESRSSFEDGESDAEEKSSQGSILRKNNRKMKLQFSPNGGGGLFGGDDQNGSFSSIMGLSDGDSEHEETSEQNDHSEVAGRLSALQVGKSKSRNHFGNVGIPRVTSSLFGSDDTSTNMISHDTSSSGGDSYYHRVDYSNEGGVDVSDESSSFIDALASVAGGYIERNRNLTLNKSDSHISNSSRIAAGIALNIRMKENSADSSVPPRGSVLNNRFTKNNTSFEWLLTEDSGDQLSNMDISQMNQSVFRMENSFNRNNNDEMNTYNFDRSIHGDQPGFITNLPPHIHATTPVRQTSIASSVADSMGDLGTPVTEVGSPAEIDMDAYVAEESEDGGFRSVNRMESHNNGRNFSSTTTTEYLSSVYDSTQSRSRSPSPPPRRKGRNNNMNDSYKIIGSIDP